MNYITKSINKPKLALLIGINYRGQDGELNGCINDVNNMRKMLIDNFGYKSENITMLTDDTEKKPTAINILNAIAKLVISAYHDKCDDIFVHYSGHGTYVKDKDGDEDDGKDEALVPLDYDKSGVITDDLLHDYFAYLPKDCRCVCLFDCCHSGTILDLPYRYIGKDDSVIENNNATVKSNIIMISGCRDKETSMDAYIVSDKKGEYSGAMTSAFLDTMLKYEYSCTCFHLLNGMRKYLRDGKYSQVPQICTSEKLSNVSIFSLKNKTVKPYLQ